MKIGIGVITMGVRKIHPNIPGKCDPDALVHIEVDHERVGPAITRNRCLKYLYDQGCDYIFMFDDDCYPMFPGWERHFIDLAKQVGVEYMGLPHAFESRLIELKHGVGWWSEVVGCFSMQSRKFMESVGYYNTAYKRYGHEDQGRNLRAKRSGLCGRTDSFPAPLRATAYIHSEDVYHEHPTPNLTHDEKLQYIEINRPVWEREVASSQIYYPFGDTHS